MKFSVHLYVAFLLSIGNTMNAQKINNPKKENLNSSQRLMISTSSNDEKEEFKYLMKESSAVHDRKTVKLLNNIFNDNKGKQESVLLVRNYSSCDIILRLQGKERYNLAVPSKGENFINLKKGSYIIKGRVCNADYSKTKDLTFNQTLTLNYSEPIKN